LRTVVRALILNQRQRGHSACLPQAGPERADAFFFSFAPAKESAREVEESLCVFFNPNSSLKVSHARRTRRKKFPFFDPAFTLQ
jgi:hypothetical protein